MIRKGAYTYILLLILLLAMVGTVSATITVQIPPQMDGYLPNSTNQTWALHYASTNSQAPDTTDTQITVRERQTNTIPGNFDRFNSAVLSFNTSNTTLLPAGVTITSAKLRLFGNRSSFTMANSPVCVLGGRLASNTTLAATDVAGWYQVGLSDSCLLAPAQPTAASNQNFTFNVTGLNYLRGNISAGSSTVIFLRDYNQTYNIMFSASTGAEATTNYNSIENANASTHPYLEVEYEYSTPTTYPINTINETRVLPNSDTNLPPVGYTVSMKATPNQFEGGGFVFKSNSGVTTTYTITGTTLTDADGTGHPALPASTTDTKIVGYWYQEKPVTDLEIYYDNSSQTIQLTPELLLNNKSILSVNYATQTNQVWVSNATWSGYVSVDNTSIGSNNWIPDWKIFDNATADGFPQPFTVPATNNQEVRLTPHIPVGTPPGNYTQKFWINSTDTPAVAINLSVRVLPFTLLDSTLDYGLYYMSSVRSNSTANDLTNNQSLTYLGSTAYLPPSVYTAELQNMKNHGIQYPFIYQYWSDSMYDGGTYYNSYNTAMQLRNALGFPTDKIFIGRGFITSYFFSSDPARLNVFGRDYVTPLHNQTTSYGYTQNYINGREESEPADFAGEIGTLNYAIGNGSKIFQTMSSPYVTNAVSVLGTRLSIVDLSFAPNATAAAQLHAIGSKVYQYGYPQAGVENPEIYRQNYGFGLWVSGYDGTMNYAYRAGQGYASWNDFDSQFQTGTLKYKDHMFTYPKTDGVIDTIEWEGMREAVDDSRYADELTRRTGPRTAALTIINAGLTAGVDMSVIRGNLIDAILALGDAVTPTASFTKNATTAIQPGSFLFNDTSSNTPTMWNWSFGDANWTNGTTQNVTHVYPSAGSYSVFLIASNIAGSSQSASQTVTVTAAANVSANFDATSAGSTVTFSDLSTGVPSPTSWIWQYRNTTSTNWTQFSTSQNPSVTLATGIYDINLTATSTTSSDSEVKLAYVTVGAAGSTVNASSLCNASGTMPGLMGIMALILAFSVLVDVISALALTGLEGDARRLATVILMLSAAMTGICLLVIAGFVVTSIPTTIACGI